MPIGPTRTQQVAVVTGLLLLTGAGGYWGAFYAASSAGYLTVDAAVPYCVGLLFVVGLNAPPSFYNWMSAWLWATVLCWLGEVRRPGNTVEAT